MAYHIAPIHTLTVALGHVAAALVFIALFMVVWVIAVTLVSE